MVGDGDRLSSEDNILNAYPFRGMNKFLTNILVEQVLFHEISVSMRNTSKDVRNVVIDQPMRSRSWNVRTIFADAMRLNKTIRHTPPMISSLEISQICAHIYNVKLFTFPQS